MKSEELGGSSTNLLKSLNADKGFKTYYFYENDILIGKYPRIWGDDTQHKRPVDSIYSNDKLKEVEKIGMISFRKKYFTPAVFKKVITDNYDSIRMDQLLINNMPSASFFARIGKTSVKYLIIQTGNDFLYYKFAD